MDKKNPDLQNLQDTAFPLTNSYEPTFDFSQLLGILQHFIRVTFAFVNERLLAMTKTYLKYGITFGGFTFVVIQSYAGQFPQDDENKSVSLEVSYIGDNVNNISGGIKTGSRYLGMVNVLFGFDTEKAGLWKGGNFYMHGANTHGAEPSQQLIGDVQVMSNVEAGNHTYLQEFWVKQKFNKIEITAGLQDLNVEFAVSELGALYLNSSYGILPVISNNFNAPIFPLTTIGLTFKWDISEKTRWINALYDGSPTDFDYNPHNLKWQFSSGDGILAISEFQKNIMINEFPGVYKAGVFSHFHKMGKNVATADSITNNLFGMYLFADQTIWERNLRNAGLFVQLGYSPSETSTNNFYLGTGINITGLLSKKAKDTFGLAVAHVTFTEDAKSETAVELTYLYQLTEHFFIQPDFQYILNPSGTSEPLPDALTANLRFGISF